MRPRYFAGTSRCPADVSVGAANPAKQGSPDTSDASGPFFETNPYGPRKGAMGGTTALHRLINVFFSIGSIGSIGDPLKCGAARIRAWVGEVSERVGMQPCTGAGVEPCPDTPQFAPWGRISAPRRGDLPTSPHLPVSKRGLSSTPDMDFGAFALKTNDLRVFVVGIKRFHAVSPAHSIREACLDRGR